MKRWKDRKEKKKRKKIEKMTKKRMDLKKKERKDIRNENKVCSRVEYVSIKTQMINAKSIQLHARDCT